jgi:hypothetical protein
MAGPGKDISAPLGKERVMGLFSSINFDSMETLLLDQMQDLYDAEQRLTKALPKVAAAAHDPTLKSAVQQHLRETQRCPPGARLPAHGPQGRVQDVRGNEGSAQGR